MKHFDINANQGRGAWVRISDGALATEAHIAAAESTTTFPLTGLNLALAILAVFLGAVASAYFGG